MTGRRVLLLLSAAILVNPAVASARLTGAQFNGLTTIVATSDTDVSNVSAAEMPSRLVAAVMRCGLEPAGGWQVMGLPTTFFVKPDGMVAKVHVGQMTADQLKENLKLILPD